MNQTARTFVLVGLVVVILLALHFLPQLTVGDTELRRVNVLSDVLPEVIQERDGIDVIPAVPDVPKPMTADARGTIAVVADSTASTPVRPPSTPDLPLSINTDSTMTPVAVDSTFVAGPVPDVPETEGQTMILDYSGGQGGGMAWFYRQLSRVHQLGRPVRVAYYGDSFIEGDIFTCDVRELLQDQFGGNGVGWVDCASQVSGFRQSVVHTTSGIKEYEVVKRPFSNSNQGIAQRYFTATDGARITYKGGKSRRHQGQWYRSIFYLRSDGGLRLQTTLNGDTTVTDTVAGMPYLQAIERHADSTLFSSVSYTLRGITPGTLLYGVAHEPATGVVVDNFSMRGSAGFTLSQIPLETLRQFASLRPYDLIVVHFGLNVASARTHASGYKSYTQRMGQAIDHLRQAYPQASFLVVSMPDRDQRTSAGLRTMNGVESLVAYQQIMASDHGVCFYNLFEAMGGRESMKSLVDQGMANRDYTHINFKGGKHLGRIFFESLMAGYHSYGY